MKGVSNKLFVNDQIKSDHLTQICYMCVDCSIQDSIGFEESTSSYLVGSWELASQVRSQKKNTIGDGGSTALLLLTLLTRDTVDTDCLHS